MSRIVSGSWLALNKCLGSGDAKSRRGTAGKTQVFKEDSLDWVVWLQQILALWPGAWCLTSEVVVILYAWTRKVFHHGSLWGQSNSTWGTRCPVFAVCQGCKQSPLPDHLLTQLWNTETSALTGSFVISCPHLGGTKRGGDWNVNFYLLPVTILHWESYGENPACSGKWHTPPIFTKSKLNFDVSLTQINLEWGQVNVAFSQDLSPIFYRNIRYPCW